MPKHKTISKAKLQLTVRIGARLTCIYCDSLNAAAHENTLMVLPQLHYLRCSEIIAIHRNPTKKPNTKL